MPKKKKKNRGFKFNEIEVKSLKLNPEIRRHKKYANYLWEEEQKKECDKTLKVRKMTKEEMEKYLKK